MTYKKSANRERSIRTGDRRMGGDGLGHGASVDEASRLLAWWMGARPSSLEGHLRVTPGAPQPRLARVDSQRRSLGRTCPFVDPARRRNELSEPGPPARATMRLGSGVPRERAARLP